MIITAYKKRLISFVMLLVFALGMAAFPALAEDNTEAEMSEDIKISEQLLEALDIIKDSDSVNTDEDITRGYFTAMVSRTLKLVGSGAEARTVFRDVTEDCKWSDEIMAMYNMGYISGGSDRKFRPEDKITVCEAVTMAVNALGYKKQAAAQGDWPSGYLAEAARLKLLTVNAEKQTVSYSEGIELMMNMLEADTLVVSDVLYDGKVEYTAEENLLSVLHKVYVLEGIVTENGLTGLYSPEANKKMIRIGDIAVQNTQEEDLYDLLGMNVKAYCRENDDKEYEYLLLKSMSKNTVYDINGTETDVMYERAGNAIKFEDDAKTKTLKLDKNFKFIYNGKLEGNYLKYLNDLSESTVRVIENSGDSYYDVLIVNTYKTLVASKGGSFSDKIISKYIGFDSIDTEKYLTLEFTDTQGSVLEPSDVSDGDVISYYASADNSYARIIKSSRSVSGKITAISESDGEYTIDGIFYKAAPTVKSGAVALFMGREGTFVLDIFGRIAEFSKDADGSERFGLLISYTDSNDYSGTCYLKMLDEYGEIHSYTLAQRVKINKKTYKRDEDSRQYAAIDSMAALNDFDDKKEDVIRFKTNADNEIESIDFAPGSIPKKKDVEDGMLYMYKKKAARMYKLDTRNLNDDFMIDSATIIFGIDTNFQYGSRDRYFITTAGAFANDEVITSEAYTTKAEPEKAEIIVYYGVPKANALYFFVINSISKSLDDDDEVVYKANGFTPSGERDLVIDAELADSLSLSAGDIIGGSSKTNSTGIVNDTELVYDYSQKKMLINGINSVFYAERAFMIYPYSYKGNIIKWFSANDRSEAEAKYINASTVGVTEDELKNTLVPAVYVADGNKKNNVYRRGDMSDIISYTQDSKDYSDIIVRSRWGNTQFVIVINK